ncbi:MAG: DNA-binding protein [Thermoproteota archaeon]|nr:DNA-binding protein [Thermoproteota archaeon]
MSEEELEELRRRRLLQIQQQLAQQQRQAQIQQEVEKQKQAVLRRILTHAARQRLTNLKMVKPNFTAQLELELIQLAQQRRISIPITDEQLKKILAQLQSRRRDIKIRRV